MCLAIAKYIGNRLVFVLVLLRMLQKEGQFYIKSFVIAKTFREVKVILALSVLAIAKLFKQIAKKRAVNIMNSFSPSPKIPIK